MLKYKFHFKVMRGYLITIIFLIPVMFGFSQGDFEKYFEHSTLRVDYIQSGNKDTSHIDLYDLKAEPHWGGPLKNLIDTFFYGMYYLNVYDSLSNELIYSRGFNTLFQEWQTTDEARSLSKGFSGSVVLPFPKNTIRLEIFQRGSSLVFQSLFGHYINPGDHFINRENITAYPVKQIVNSGDPNHKVDIVFLPEGYTTDEMTKFNEDVKRFVDAFFNWEPYINYRDFFNIWLVEAPSRESGTDHPGDTIWKNTLLNSNFYTFDLERYLTTSDIWRVRDVSANAPYDQICILVNEEKYGGGGIYNFYSIFTSDNEDWQFVFLHEFGHGFAGLADEYYSSAVSYNDYYDLSVEPYEPNITTFVDFDRKWKDMVGKDVPVPTPVDSVYFDRVGVFEGGGYMAKGIYRPYHDCTMKSRSVNNFCPVCRHALEQMILFYSDKETAGF